MIRNSFSKRILIAAGLLPFPPSVFAAELQIGALGYVSTPYLKEQKSEMSVLPYFNFEYGLLGVSLGGLSLSVPLNLTDVFEVGLTYRTADANDINVKELKSRDTAIEASIGWSESSPTGLTFSAFITADINSAYDGYLMTLGLEQSHTFDETLDNLSVEFTINYYSSNLVNYNYAVSSAESSSALSAYQSDQGAFSYAVNLGYLHPITHRYASYIGGELQYFSTAITDSPLLEKPWASTVFVGLMASF